MTAPARGVPVAPPRIPYTDHLVALIARAEAAGTVIVEADPDRRAAVVADARRHAAFLSARLDASPLSEDTAAAVDARLAEGLPPTEAATPSSAEPAATGWARTLKLDGMPSQDIAAVEYANLLRCFDAEGALAATVFEDPLGTMHEVHRLVCEGLVAADALARARRTEQAVHDGAQGLVLYHAAPADDLPGLLEALTRWLRGPSARLPALVVAGVAHERLLEWQPFEAANGRVARVFARLVLRARGLDPHGAAVPERVLVRDPLGYLGEVAATIRRRGDVVPWLERWGEALCLALEAAAAPLRPATAVTPPHRATRVAEGLDPGETVTLGEYAELVGVAQPTARMDLAALERAGLVELDPGAHGLRWRRPPAR